MNYLGIGTGFKALSLMSMIFFLSSCDPMSKKEFLLSMDSASRGILFSGEPSDLTKDLELLCESYESAVVIAEYEDGIQLECDIETLNSGAVSISLADAPQRDGVLVNISNPGFSQSMVAREVEGKVRAWSGVIQLK